MAKYVIEDTTLNNTANAIREKTGKTDKITPSNFATEIASIETGGDTTQEDGLIEGTLTEYSNDRITQLGNHCFRGFGSLASVNIPNVIVLGFYAFYDCDALETIELPSPNLYEIKGQCFRTSDNLKRVSLPNVTFVPTLGTEVFTTTPISSGTGYIYVPDALVDSFKSATNWSTYADQIKPISELEVSS